MLPFVGSKLGVPKHPSKLSKATRTFSANLNRLVDYYDLNPTSAGRKCKVPAVQINRWMKCEIAPNLDSLYRVARGFGIEPYQLLIEGLEPKNLATVIAADTLARISRARELMKDLDSGPDEEGDGETPSHRPDSPRPGSGATDARGTSNDRRRTQEKKSRP